MAKKFNINDGTLEIFETKMEKLQDRTDGEVTKRAM